MQTFTAFRYGPNGLIPIAALACRSRNEAMAKFAALGVRFSLVLED